MTTIVRRARTREKREPTREVWSSEFVQEISLFRAYSYYMIFSFLYYFADWTPIPDHLYDELCVRLGKEWDELEHPHKHLSSKEDMIATTGYAIVSYPDRVIGASLAWVSIHYPDRHDDILQTISNRRGVRLNAISNTEAGAKEAPAPEAHERARRRVPRVHVARTRGARRGQS